MLSGLVALVLAVLVGGALLIRVYGDQNRNEGSLSTTGDTSAEAVGDMPEGDVEESADEGTVAITEVETTASSITVHTDAAPGLADCAMKVTGALVDRHLASLDCDRITIEGLPASDTYTIELYGPGRGADEPDSEPIVRTVSTDTVYGEVYWDCPDTRTYCREQGGEPGIRGEAEERDPIGYAPVGAVYELTCYEIAEEITPRGEELEGYWDYHPHKDASPLMMRIEYGHSHGYIPFVWLIVDEADLDSTGGLAPCPPE
jgi:hypothetical protein